MAGNGTLISSGTDTDSRWNAIVSRDKSVDGQFLYSVRTTGVYCRPSCATKLAKPENVQFHDTREDAERAGFRPCKKCKPNESNDSRTAMVERICRLIDSAEENLPLLQLAREAGMSVSHFQRTFTETVGVSPKEYADARRAQRLRVALTGGQCVTDAIFEAGFNSTGRFYEQSNALLGMTPKCFKAGGRDCQIHFAIGQCTLGAILVGATAAGICAILMGDDPEELIRELQDRFANADLIGGDRAFEQLVATVVGFVEHPAIGLNLPLDIRGTAFQKRVWEQLRKIPPGTTLSYAQLAALIGSPKAVRAVATACAANPLAVAIPCHRVVRTDGALSGYRWGIERKRTLIDRERRQSEF